MAEYELTYLQGQLLFQASITFIFPDARQEDVSYFPAAPMERKEIIDDVFELFKELKSHSPLYTEKKKSCFGDLENWDVKNLDHASESYTMKDVAKTIKVKLSDAARNGVYWCLVRKLHPMSAAMAPVADQAEVFWPLAERLRLRKELGKATGADKATHRKLEFDKTPEEEAEAEAEAKTKAKAEKTKAEEKPEEVATEAKKAE